MAVVWIRKTEGGNKQTRREILAVTVDRKAVVLSSALRRELLGEDGQDQPLRILLGFAEGSWPWRRPIRPTPKLGW